MCKADTIHKADLRLTDISNMLGTDWVGLARELEISDSDINIIKSQYPDNAPKQAIVMLRLWMQTSGNKANGNTLEKGLRKIGRDDIVNQCIFNVELVTDDIEKAMAKAHLDQSGFDAFRYELGPSRDTTLNRDVSLDVSYDEQDMMKEAESAEEEEENQRSYQDKTRREQHTADMSPTYESEEKKYAGEEKIVTEEKITKEEIRDGSAVTVTTTTTSVVTEPVTESKKEAVIKPKEEPKDEAIITEKVVQEDRKVPPTKEAEKVEDKVPKPEKGGEKPVVLDKAEEKMVEKVDEEVVEQKVEEKPVVKDVEKSTDVGEKAKDITERLEEKAQEVPPASLDEAQKAGTTTATEVITGPDGTTTSSTTTTTERRSFTTEDDGTVKEHIVIEKKTTSFVDGLETGEDKSEILQKLGEELGRLDEQLEERFKEKRKAVEPEVAQEEVRETTVVAKRREGQAEPTSQVVVEHSHQPTSLSATITSTTTTTSITPTPDGFTQASVESRQMSSTGGTTEVSTKGTAITATEPVTGDETVMQMGQGTHEATQIAEHQTTTVSQEQASSGLPTPGTKAGSAHGKSKLTEADLAVLESMVIAQEAEVEEMAFAHDQAEAQAKAQEEQLQARNQGQQQKPKVKGQKKQGQAKRQQQQGKVEEQSLPDKAQGHIQQEKGKDQLKDKKGALPDRKNETQSKVGQVQQNEEGQKQPSHMESLIQPAQAQQAQSEDLAQTTQVQVESLIQSTQEKGQAQQVQVESLIQPTQVKSQTRQVQVESLIQPTQEIGQAQVQVESLIQPTQVKSQAQQVQAESLIQPTQEKNQAQQVQVESLIQPTQVKGQAQVQLEDLSQPISKKSQAHSQAGVKDQMQQGQAEYIIQQTQGLAQQPQTGEATQGQLGLTHQLRVNGHQQEVQLGQTFIQKEGQFSQDQAQTLVQQETPSKQVQPEATTKVRQSTTRVTSPGKGHSATLASAATPVGQEKQQQQFGDLTKRVADVASTMASTLESITAVAEGLEGSHLSSDEGEEQLMLMRDSPRWEDEEIQAEDTDEPRAIKAEIKLLVKTTEVGKESIEIRSIREFVESDEKNLAGFGGVVPSPVPEAGRVTPQGDRVYTLQRSSPSARTPSPRFVRQQQSSPVSSYIQPTHDEFDLMAQVRDVVQPDSGAGARQAPGSSGGRKSKTGK